ncbi:ethanolamine ammonia-lyase subunit EutB [Domibacillus enclensis]|uniref:Ethanolamine ammonia-lyase large subunit n=1 Tax=Domibacillus enclensis TaxID=1017273 RepID=A0A1N6ZEL5_9BACI|nr:ethanolamine ammonia-lyase subunit EutB [Domibacillus enclensis]OXS76682.1 ethanolamine ammonia lyase large subunit [Domibacillus enclensis]SIR25253.1 Ethanolamine ammonia-lyase heavy chain [Domibacillus enclensis]
MEKKTVLLGETYQFASLKEVLAKANEERSGDELAGIAAANMKERMAAKVVLADVTLSEIRNYPLLSPEEDEVSRIIEEGLDESIYKAVQRWTVADLREYILSDEQSGADLLKLGTGLTSEMIAAAAKIMSNLDLIQAASKIEIITHCQTHIGAAGTLASRAQPNHPSDNLQGMRASAYEALSYGIGDAMIGINPVIDTTDNIAALLKETKEIIDQFSIPTQNCVLSHVTSQIRAIEKGAPADLIFQSLAGSQAAIESFGISVSMLDEATALINEKGTATGPNRWYLETGQGSELSSNSHFDIDQVTLESRCYGLARRYNPFLVNTVVGFIGPEYLYDSKQVMRAGLEDHFMGKMHGLPMGVDVCYTNHMKADQNDMDNLSTLLAAAGVNFVIGVPMADDCMLNYQSLSYHDIATLRSVMKLKPASAFEQWLEQIGIMQNGKLSRHAGDPAYFLTLA